VATDHPADMGEIAPERHVRALPGVDTAARRAIFAGNAARLFEP